MMKFIYCALPLMATSVVMFIEMNPDRPWWLIPFAGAQILLLAARSMEDKLDEKIRELERKVDEMSKGGSLDGRA